MPVRIFDCRLAYQIFVKFCLNDSSELLEIMFDIGALHSLVVIGKTISECVDDCLI